MKIEVNESENQYRIKCGDCGMEVVFPDEYHPYAACLMFKACGNPKTVTDNLDSVIAYGLKQRKEQTP